MVDLGLFANIVSAASSAYDIYNKSKQTNELIDYGKQASGQSQQALNEQMRYAQQMAAAAQQQTDPEALGRTMGIFRAILAGQEPSELGPFRSQFEEIENSVQAKLRDIDREATDARFRISDTIPDSGMKMRMLADIAMKTQDLKATAIKEGRDTIRDTNMKLRNEYMGKALEFGKSQPEQFRAMLGGAGNILTGQANQGVSGNTALLATTKLTNEASQQGASIGEQIGKLVNKPATTVTQPQVGSEATLPTSAQKYLEDETSQSNADKWYGGL